MGIPWGVVPLNSYLPLAVLMAVLAVPVCPDKPGGWSSVLFFIFLHPRPLSLASVTEHPCKRMQASGYADSPGASSPASVLKVVVKPEGRTVTVAEGPQ